MQEVQAITTSTYTGPNEIQSITTSAKPTNEVQVIHLVAPAVREVQAITLVGATGGYYFLSLNTNTTGGSLQHSGFIFVNYPADDSTSDTFGKNVQDIISAMSNVKSNGQVTVSLDFNSGGTQRYLVTFPESMGNVPQMSIYSAELTGAGQPSATVTTVTQGNVISGSYTLTFEGKTTAAIASDATENDVRVALEALSTVGSVIVTRSSVDYQHGYRWTVEFDSTLNAGNIQTMIADGTLLTTTSTGFPSSITVTSTDGNQVGGTFRVSLVNNGITGVTSDISYSATESQFKAALVSMTNNVIPAGAIAVSRVGPDAQRGYTWTVTFLSDYARTFEGDLNEFTFDTTNLTGEDAVATTIEVRKGTYKEVQRIAVTSTGVVASTTMMRLSYDGSITDSIAVRPDSGNCSSSIVEVQTITSSTVRLLLLYFCSIFHYLYVNFLLLFGRLIAVSPVAIMMSLCTCSSVSSTATRSLAGLMRMRTPQETAQHLQPQSKLSSSRLLSSMLSV